MSDRWAYKNVDLQVYLRMRDPEVIDQAMRALKAELRGDAVFEMGMWAGLSIAAEAVLASTEEGQKWARKVRTRLEEDRRKRGIHV